MWDQALRDFVMLFVTIDPVGTLALFVPLTATMALKKRRRVALRAVVFAGAVLLGFLIAGEGLLAAMGIRLPSFQLAGGIVLFLFGLQMVFGSGVAAAAPQPEADHDIAIFPLALPSLASPGAIMAVVLLTENHRRSIAQQAITIGALGLVLTIALTLLLCAQPIHRLLGATGAAVMIRVLGLLLCALAVEQTVAAVTLLLHPPA